MNNLNSLTEARKEKRFFNFGKGKENLPLPIIIILSIEKKKEKNNIDSRSGD